MKFLNIHACSSLYPQPHNTNHLKRPTCRLGNDVLIHESDVSYYWSLASSAGWVSATDLLSLEWQSGETEPQHRETVLVQANEEHATLEVGTRPSACQIFNGTSRRTPIFVQNNTKMSLTMNWSLFPCTCQYKYFGWSGTTLQYGNPYGLLSNVILIKNNMTHYFNSNS